MQSSWALRVYAAGVLAIVLVLAKLHAAVISSPQYDITSSAGALGWTLAFAALLIFNGYVLGLPQLPPDGKSAMIRSAAAGLLAAATVSLIQLVTVDTFLSRSVVVGAALLMIPWGWGCYRWSKRSSSRQSGDRVVLVGSAAQGAVLADDLNRSPEHRAWVVERLPVEEPFPTFEEIQALLRTRKANLVVLSPEALQSESVLARMAELHLTGVRIRSLLQFYEDWLGKIPADDLERSALFFDIGEVHRSSYARMKRAIDVVTAAFLLVPLALITPVVWLGNMWGNRGPMFYRQERVGRSDEPFQIIKFRTMAPSDGPTTWTQEGDPRVTRFGKILRASHVDEMPQVINVLRGHLSMVGPRPEQTSYVEVLEKKLPFYALRHSVRPGITGWAQVKYPYGSSEHDAEEKLQYDFYYLRHQGLGLDLTCVLRTLRSMIQFSGR